MDNYHTTADCGCSQNRQQRPMPEKPCREPMPCHPMAQKPCPADIPGRPMAQKPCPAPMPRRQMVQKPCPASMPRRQMAQKPCPADIPGRPMPTCPPMPAGCPDKPDPLAGMPVGMAYVPWQFFRKTFDLDKALQCGTIFPELSKPFLGKGGCPR